MKMFSKMLCLAVGALAFTASAALAGTVTYNATSVTVQGDGAGHLSAGAPITGTLGLNVTAGPTITVPASVFQQQQTLTYTVNGGIVQLGATGAPITSGNAGTACTISPNCTVGFGAQVTGKLSTSSNNLAGSFGPGGGDAGGFGGVLSTGAGAVVNAYVDAFGWKPLTVVLPLNVIGSGGMVTTTLTILGTYLGKIIVTGFKWTTGMITGVGGKTGSDFVTTGTNNLTSGGQGSVTLVTPFIVNVTGAGAQTRAGYAKITLVSVPEPGTLLLLGAGIAGLVAVGRRRKTA